MKKIKKKNIFQRTACILCAGLLALLPFGSFFGIQQQEKIGASAEAFDDAFDFGSANIPLDSNSSILNPYSFFDFSIRRPTGDWSGTYDNYNLNVYSFSMPQYLTDIEFLRDNGVITTNSVFNYLPLYSGSIYMSFNQNSSNWLLYTKDFPSPVADFDLISNPRIVSTFRMTISEKLVPLVSLQSIFSTESILTDPSNCFKYSYDIVYLNYDDKEPFSVEHFVSSSGDAFLPHSESLPTLWEFSSLFDSIGLNSNTISNYVFSPSINAVYVKNLDLQFYYNPEFTNLTMGNGFSFDFTLPSGYFNISKSGYLSLCDSYSDFITQTTFVPVSPLQNIFDIVSAFFNIELFPGFSLNYILYIGVAGLIIGFAIKIFLQG